MENFSHTLVGLALAKAGLERATPLATSALVISANLPDIDVLSRLGGTTGSYLEYHRGFTHSLVGLALLASALTLMLTWVDRRFRMRRDPFRRPLRPWRVLAISYAGGLSHLFLDFTNAYGVRPFLPFSDRWVYGDLIFVADPWIWLILGSAVVWLTMTDPPRTVFLPRLFIWFKIGFWLIAGVLASLLVALALSEPAEAITAIPFVARLAWFAGFAIIIAGLLLGWGRAGSRLARVSLIALAVYYGGMWMARQTAVDRARSAPPAEGVAQVAAWPMPANPLLWQAVTTTEGFAYSRYVNLAGSTDEWREARLIDPRFIEALRQSSEARRFLDFARVASATVHEREDGYTVLMQDLRFSLRMRAELDRDLSVISADVRW
jgi:inner membrane protein